MADFKEIMGEQNHLILYAPRQQAEIRITAQQEEARTQRLQEVKEVDHLHQADGDDVQQGRAPLPWMMASLTPS